MMFATEVAAHPVGRHLWRQHRDTRETSFTPTGCVFCILSLVLICGVEVRCSRLKSLLPVGCRHLWRHHRDARETSFTPTGCVFCILSWGLICGVEA